MLNQTQINFAKTHGFRVEHDSEQETVFVCYFDHPEGLRKGERYSSDGWASAPGHGRLLTTVTVYCNRGKWTVTRCDRGRGRIKSKPHAKRAWRDALELTRAMRRGGWKLVTDQVPFRAR